MRKQHARSYSCSDLSSLSTISFPGRTSISFVDGEDTPIALDLCTPVSLLFYLIFIIFSVRQRHGASWAIPLGKIPTSALCRNQARLTQDEGHRLVQDGLPVIIFEQDMRRTRENRQLLGG